MVMNATATSITPQEWLLHVNTNVLQKQKYIFLAILAYMSSLSS